MTTPEASTPAEPALLLEVVAGKPTDEEMAALVAVVAARRGGPAAELPAEPSGWSAHWRRLRAPVTIATNGWQMSGLPH